MKQRLWTCGIVLLAFGCAAEETTPGPDSFDTTGAIYPTECTDSEGCVLQAPVDRNCGSDVLWLGGATILFCSAEGNTFLRGDCRPVACTEDSDCDFGRGLEVPCREGLCLQDDAPTDGLGVLSMCLKDTSWSEVCLSEGRGLDHSIVLEVEAHCGEDLTAECEIPQDCLE